MNSTLESSVTLDDVFLVVGARRVPLAPELAGYLALEIAEGASHAAGDVDPRSVYIGEEGSVALVVRPRREQQAGDAEASIRAFLSKLLDASGSQTPALASAARRRPSVGLHVLVEELEAALIPVNRAAGRRALARLAREVKRVTLGVGRNASLAPGEPAPKRGSSPSHTATREGGRPPQEDARPPTRSGPTDEPSTSAQRDGVPAPAPLPSPSRTPEPPPALGASASDAPVTRSTSPEASELPTMEVRRHEILLVPSGSPPKVEVNLPREETPPPRPPAPRAVDEVDHLLASFGVSSHGEQSQRNELKALVGLEPTPPPGSADAPDSRVTSASDSDVESLLAISDAAPAVKAASSGPGAGGVYSPPTAISPTLASEPYRVPGRSASVATPGDPTPQPRARIPSDERPTGTRAVPTAPSARRLAEMSSEPNITAPRDRSLTVFALVILALGGAAIWFLRPALLGGHEPRPAPAPVTAAPASAAPPLASRCRASLIVTGAPANAEILLRAGQAPVDVEKMPVGPRLEFVATAEGYGPKRAVIPAGATWDTGPDGKPRYEVAVQLDHSRARSGAADAWPAGEPGSDVGGKGSPGTVHLVTTPRGAEVWQLVALGPDAQFDVKCGAEVEILVAGPTTLRKRIRIAEAEFVAADGGVERQATISASGK